MEQEPTIRDPSIPVLVYYKARGHAQIIRSTLLEIGVPFQEVYVSSEHGIPKDIAQQYKLSMKNVPYLIHENQAISEKLGILRYCCCRFNRGDLFGIGTLNEIKIIEVLSNYVAEKSRVFNWVLQMVTEWAKSNLKEKKQSTINEIKQNLLKKLKQLRYFQVLKKRFIAERGFLFGHITILDFIFYEACFNLTGILGERLRIHDEQIFLYKDFFEQTDFYKKHGQQLQSYSMIVPDVPIMVNRIFSEIWQGDNKYIPSCFRKQQKS